MKKVFIKNVFSLADYLKRKELSTGNVFTSDGDCFIELKDGDLTSFHSGRIIKKEDIKYITRLKKLKEV